MAIAPPQNIKSTDVYPNLPSTMIATAKADKKAKKPLTAKQLEAKIELRLLNRIDDALDMKLTDALSDYGMFTAATYRRACTQQADKLTKAPTPPA